MDAFLLHALLPELVGWTGGSVRAVEQTAPRTLQIAVRKDDETRYLALSCDPDFPRVEPLTVPEPRIEPGAFVNTLKVYLSRAVLAEIRQIGFDRRVAFGFSRRPTFGPSEQVTLMLRLFGRSANLYLESSDGSLVSLKPGVIPRSRKPGGRTAAVSRLEVLSTTLESVREMFAAFPDMGLHDALVRRFTGISPFWADEILFRADLEPTLPLGRLRPWQVDLTWSHLAAWVALIKAGRFEPCVYVDPETKAPVAVSPVPVRHLEGKTCTRFGRVSEAVSAYYRSTVPAERDAALRDKIERRLREESKRVLRSLERVAVRTKQAAREAEFRRFGELILANLGTLTRGRDEVSVIDHYNLDRPHIRIPVNPAKSPRGNAEMYFAKARKAQRAKKALARERERLARRRDELDAEIRDLPSLEREALRAVARNLGLLPREGRAAGVSKKEVPAPFRTFQTTTGWTVWVGRNDRENDLLTHSRAAPHDYWFHARGLAGSHVVLRRPDRNQRPSRKTIQEAAQIAAYYSKGRRSKTVDVTYTEKKYVRKPRKGKPGLALVTNEEVVFVSPRLPGKP